MSKNRQFKTEKFLSSKNCSFLYKKTCSWETLFTQHIPSNTGRPREIIEIPRGFGVLLSTKGWKGSRRPQGILEILGFPGRPGGPEGYLGFLKYHWVSRGTTTGSFSAIPSIFNFRFFNELKHKVCLSKTACGIFRCRFRFVFIKIYIFVQWNAWTI